MNDVLRVVSVYDQALDVGVMNENHESGRPRITVYYETRDESLPVAVPGGKLTWFHTRRLRTSEYAHVADGGNLNEQRMRAFSIGVTKIENFSAVGSKSVGTCVPEGKQRTGARVITYFTDEQMDSISPAYVNEIGEVIRQRSFLAHEHEVSYPPPPSFLQVWTARCARYAADLVQKSRSQNSEPASQTPSPTHPSGEPDTDASATDSPT